MNLVRDFHGQVCFRLPTIPSVTAVVKNTRGESGKVEKGRTLFYFFHLSDFLDAVIQRLLEVDKRVAGPDVSLNVFA